MSRQSWGVALLLLCMTHSSFALDVITGRVVSIADGDTVTVLDAANQQHKIRLSGIDAPEKAQAFGNRSKQHLSDAVYGKLVEVEVYKRDRYRREVGVIRLGGLDMNLKQVEVVTPALRHKLMPGKATVPMAYYDEAFAAAVEVFGRGQVSTYILAGLGDTRDTLLETCQKLVDMGVYPFVVPFIPISGTPLEDHPSPSAAFMDSVLAPLGQMLNTAGMRSADMKAGCGKCGACSALASYEVVKQGESA